MTNQATTTLTHTAEQKSNPAAGTDSRLASTAVQPHCVTQQRPGSTVGVEVLVNIPSTSKATAASQ
jgi:hypothetical protein